jgi:hypothetical protein
MATQPRTAEQAEARRQDLRTLIIASIASAVAAVVVSQFWFAGTWIAAALTPVLVAVFREVIERPTTKIAERVTTDRTAVQPRVVMPPDEEPRVEPRGPEAAAPEPSPMKVYGTSQSSRKRKLAIRAAVITGLLAFVIAFSVITITDLVTGGSIGGGEKRLTFGGGKKADEPEQAPPEQGQEQPEEEPQQPQQTVPEEQPEQTVPQTTPTQPQQTAPQTTPTQPPGG